MHVKTTAAVLPEEGGRTDDLVRSLSYGALERLETLGVNRGDLEALFTYQRAIAATDASVAVTEGGEEGPAEVLPVGPSAAAGPGPWVEAIDEPFRRAVAPEQGRYHPTTPGELCHRLMRLTTRIEHHMPLQHDARMAPEQRRTLLDAVYTLHTTRTHLQFALRQLLDDLAAGTAVLPPRPSFEKYDNPHVDPVTRKEVSIDVYGIARKLPSVPRGIRHILGLVCNGHGASMAYVGENGALRSTVFDRWVGTKYTLLLAESEWTEMQERASPIAAEMHDLLVYSYGAFPPYRLFEEAFPLWLDWFLSELAVGPDDIDLLISSESNFVTSAFRLRSQMSRWLPNAQVVTHVEHHTVHQAQAFWQSGFPEAAVLTLDTCGESLTRLNHHKIAGSISILDERGRLEVLREFAFPHASAGLIYSIVNHHLGFTQGEEGKTMGLAPYGTPKLYRQLAKYLRLYPDGSFDFLPFQVLRTALEAYEPERPRRVKGAPFTDRHRDIAYAGQALIEDIVTHAFRAALDATGKGNLVYAGGLALNSVANEIANRAAQPAALYIPPNPGDTGQALGCALHAAFHLAGWKPWRREIPEYLGPSYSPGAVRDAVRRCRHTSVRVADPEEVIARCIANGHIVARFAGAAEFGPRALGNRSILADPRREDMKDYLNARVKHREGYRPFAPSVLLEHASDWFQLEGRSPYMLRVVHVPPHLQERIPAIVHVDGTARVQTVERAENPGYWTILHAFHCLTGVPVFLNTSFNIAGKPIVETPDDAVACFEGTHIDVLLLEDWILSKQPLETYTHRPR